MHFSDSHWEIYSSWQMCETCIFAFDCFTCQLVVNLVIFTSYKIQDCIIVSSNNKYYILI